MVEISTVSICSFSRGTSVQPTDEGKYVSKYEKVQPVNAEFLLLLTRNSLVFF
jgi:hypothetical protein